MNLPTIIEGPQADADVHALEILPTTSTSPRTTETDPSKNFDDMTFGGLAVTRDAPPPSEDHERPKSS